MDKNSPTEISKPTKTFKVKIKKVNDNLTTQNTSFDPDSGQPFPVQVEKDGCLASKETHGKIQKKNIISPPKSPAQQIRTSNRVKTLQLPKSPEYEKKIQGILIDLEKNKKKAEIKEQLAIGKLSPREKLISERQKKVLESNEKKSIQYVNKEHCLTERALKLTEKLSPLRNDRTENKEIIHNNEEKTSKDKFYWYFNLRSPTPRQRMRFIPCNSKDTGIYALVREKGNKKLSCSPRKANLDELNVLGVCKLPLEVEALRKRGAEYLNLGLVDRTEYNEIIEEQYDEEYLIRD